MRKIIVAIVLVGALGGCTGMSDTQQRALTGTVGGAGVGAVLGAIGGNAGLGAAAGAAAGLAGGLIFDQVKKNEAAAYQQGVAAGRRQSSN
ncbi:MAG: glycine zipper family protein [Acetobacteraceae bacterium]